MTLQTALPLFNMSPSDEASVVVRDKPQGVKKELSPMLVNYLEYKQKYPDYIIFYQVGDFYEIFFEDAVTVSRSINITLTSRDKTSESPIPMCGVPVGAIENYSEKLIEAGLSCAIISQSESLPGQKNIQRFLEKIITPGVKLFAGSNAKEAILVAVSFDKAEEVSLAWSSVQSGQVITKDFISLLDASLEIKRLNPQEIIFPTSYNEKPIDRRSHVVRALISSVPEIAVRMRVIPFSQDLLSSVTGTQALSWGTKTAVKLLLSFIDEVALSRTSLIKEVSSSNKREGLFIDARTRDNLDIFLESRTKKKEFSLFGYLDRAITIGGSRVVRSFLEMPLTNKQEIEARLLVVEYFNSHDEEREKIKSLFRTVQDIERIAARMKAEVVTPLECAAVRDAFEIISPITNTLSKCPLPLIQELLKEIPKSLKMYEVLKTRLHDEPSHSFLDGSVIKDGFSERLDELRELRGKSREWIQRLEDEEKVKTGISSLKLKFTSSFGFFIEITKANLSKVPSHYKRKQTTVGGERFTTEALEAKEAEIRTAEYEEIKEQKKLYDDLKKEISSLVEELYTVSNSFSQIDALISFSTVALEENLIKPKISTSRDLKISEGAHPVLKRIIKNEFVTNSVNFDNETLGILLTGPNMGGKSTYLRQIGMITIMAHCGSFVPAKSCEIGIVDRLFARIGASDNLLEGESTFMVEMREAAYITTNATENSLVLIDELGRGTSTQEGVALAQSVYEWLVVERKAKTLFASHYHELIELAAHNSQMKNFSVQVIEKDNSFIFTHSVAEGEANKSYGVEVAHIAGVPQAVISRAKEILSFDDGAIKEKQYKTPVFEHINVVKNILHDEVIKALSNLSINSMTPLQALESLSQLQERLKK